MRNLSLKDNICKHCTRNKDAVCMPDHIRYRFSCNLLEIALLPVIECSDYSPKTLELLEKKIHVKPVSTNYKNTKKDHLSVKVLIAKYMRVFLSNVWPAGGRKRWSFIKAI